MAKTKTSSSSSSSSPQMTCFVVIGFGRKTDFATGRVLDLDRTYEQLIRPAFDKVDVNCFRAIDANLTGSIDSIMYQWIYQADFVIADLSTLNANVFYELGVRHAQRPNTTIIIAESVLMQKIPFDLSSFVIHQYQHGGDEIAAAEQERFVGHLAGVLEKIVDVETARRRQKAKTERQSDSPVYTFLSGMAPPSYTFKQYLAPPAYVPPEKRPQKVAEEGDSLGSMMEAAELAKRNRDFENAIRLFKQAIEMDTRDKDKPDTFLAQRLALVTYKHGERKGADGKIDVEVAKQALFDAERILETWCAPRLSNDPETLGLMGAINKRLFDHTDDMEYLDRAIRFYERGFYVKQDYYNGINVAFMYTMRANLMDDDPFEAVVSYGHGNMIRKKVAEICEEMTADTAGFQARGDKQWVLMTLAEAYQGMGRAEDAERLMPKIKAEATEFGMSSFLEQKEKLAAAMAQFQGRVPAELLSQAARATAQAAPARASTTVRGAAAPGQGPISISPELLEGKAVRSIEVSCKIEYA